MPILAGFIMALFGALVDFLVVFFTRTVAIKLAFAALITGAFTVLFVAMNLAVSGLAYTAPAFLVTAFAFVFPANIVPCIAAAVACDSVVAGFRLFMGGVNV